MLEGSQSPSGAIAAAPVTHWALLPDIRRSVIEQMRTREAFVQALEANPERGAGVMQKCWTPTYSTRRHDRFAER